ncbi:MAG: hypothetical protein JWR61_740 [Ferruginibacter sp.]|nr:hypothetical protein [Ferruginibacter sp.]
MDEYFCYAMNKKVFMRPVQLPAGSFKIANGFFFHPAAELKWKQINQLQILKFKQHESKQSIVGKR